MAEWRGGGGHEAGGQQWPQHGPGAAGKPTEGGSQLWWRVGKRALGSASCHLTFEIGRIGVWAGELCRICDVARLLPGPAPLLHTHPPTHHAQDLHHLCSANLASPPPPWRDMHGLLLRGLLAHPSNSNLGSATGWKKAVQQRLDLDWWVARPVAYPAARLGCYAAVTAWTGRPLAVDALCLLRALSAGTARLSRGCTSMCSGRTVRCPEAMFLVHALYSKKHFSGRNGRPTPPKPLLASLQPVFGAFCMAAAVATTLLAEARL